MTVSTNTSVDTGTGVDGNTVTNGVSNDTLTNEDFLNLMLTELKMQDPTQPMDSQRMLDNQMQMSTIQTNITTAETMEKLAEAYTQSSLTNAANVIGKNVEDGNVSESGINKAYTVTSVEQIDGDVYLKAREILYLEDVVNDKDGNPINYNVAGEIIGPDGEKTGEKITLVEPGLPALDEDGNLIILDKNNEVVEEHEYELAGGTIPVYSDQISTIPFNEVTKIF